MSTNHWSQLSKAIALASEAFINDLDRGGKPYILHLMRVMQDVGNHTNWSDPELLIIAVLHDLVEDKDVSAAWLFEQGYSDRVVDALFTLSHSKDIDYMEYIEGTSKAYDTTIVKMADLRDNSNIHRMKGLREKDFERLKKYHIAYDYLLKHGKH